MTTLKTLLALALALAAAAPAGAVTKDEIKKILEKNPELILDVLKTNKKAVFQIISSAAQEEQNRRMKEEQEAEKKEFEESFKNPKSPDISESTRIRGKSDAPLTLVEYSDFQCPYCARGYRTVEALRKKYGERLRFVYKHMPLPMHPQAMPAAQLIEAAALQSVDKAWAMHDKFFENQDKLGDEFYEKTAKELDLNWKKLQADAKSKAVSAKIEADVEEGKKFGFSGTPGFLLNGVPVRGAYPPEFFDSIVARIDAPKDAKKDDAKKADSQTP